MKTYIVLLRKGNIITRHEIAARDGDTAGNIAINRFGGIVLNVLLGYTFLK